MMRLGLCAVCALLVAAGAAFAILSRPLSNQPLAFDARSFGPPDSGAPAELWRPAGPGPFPAMLVLHGCGGVGDGERQWAMRLVGWGYVAVIVDSFGPRNVSSTCRRDVVPAHLRARDAIDAAAHLRTLPGIIPDRIGVIGFSHGGTTALYTALETERPLEGGTSSFAAAVAYYPWCGIPTASSGLAIDTLIFIGRNDRPASIDVCSKLIARLAGTPHAPTLKVYPGVGHEFDTVAGSTAAADSFAVTRDFLAAHLEAHFKAHIKAR
jgi:dienelactone hydrolase